MKYDKSSSSLEEMRKVWIKAPLL